jgi:hypothetical protein
LDLNYLHFSDQTVNGCHNQQLLSRALAGAERTIREHAPWIMIENKPAQNKYYGRANAAEVLLSRFGYELVKKIGEKQIDWLYRPGAAI